MITIIITQVFFFYLSEGLRFGICLTRSSLDLNVGVDGLPPLRVTSSDDDPIIELADSIKDVAPR